MYPVGRALLAAKLGGLKYIQKKEEKTGKDV